MIDRLCSPLLPHGTWFPEVPSPVLTALLLAVTLAAAPAGATETPSPPPHAAESRPAPPAFGELPWEREDPFCTRPLEPLSGLGAGLDDLATDLLVGLAAAALPTVGARIDRSRPALQLAWPVSFAFGPATGETRRTWRCGTPRYRHRPLRLMVEPGFALTRPVTLFLRPGARFVWHRPHRLVGLGAGVGSTVELRGPDAARASLGAELLLHLGRCCAPGFVLLSLRYDRFFSGAARDAVSVGVGVAVL